MTSISFFPRRTESQSLIVNRRPWMPWMAVVLLATFLQGCVSVPKREPVPDAIYEVCRHPWHSQGPVLGR